MLRGDKAAGWMCAPKNLTSACVHALMRACLRRLVLARHLPRPASKTKSRYKFVYQSRSRGNSRLMQHCSAWSPMSCSLRCGQTTRKLRNELLARVTIRDVKFVNNACGRRRLSADTRDEKIRNSTRGSPMAVYQSHGKSSTRTQTIVSLWNNDN